MDVNFNKSLTFGQGSRIKACQKGTQSELIATQGVPWCFLSRNCLLVRPSNPLLAFECVLVLLQSLMVLLSQMYVNIIYSGKNVSNFQESVSSPTSIGNRSTLAPTRWEHLNIFDRIAPTLNNYNNYKNIFWTIKQEI